MEKMSFIFFVIIVVYLLYAFFKARSEKVEEKTQAQEEKRVSSPEEKNSDVERAAIAAVIAAIMGDATYVIKRVYAVATVDEKKSTWRYAGRNELMTAKNTLK